MSFAADNNGVFCRSGAGIFRDCACPSLTDPTDPSCAVVQTSAPTYNHSGVPCTSTFRGLFYANDTPLTFESFTAGAATEWYWHSEDPTYSPANRPGMTIRLDGGRFYAWLSDYFGNRRFGGTDLPAFNGKDITDDIQCDPVTGNLVGTFTLYNVANFCTGGDAGTLPVVVTLANP